MSEHAPDRGRLDSTDESAVQRSLRTAEERFERAFAEAPIGMTLISVDPDTHGRYIRVNRAFCDLTGYAEEELVGRHFSEITHPDDYHDGHRQVERRIAAGEMPSYELEKRYIRRDGTAIWVCAHATLIRDAQGHPVEVVSMVLDINEQKRRERLEAQLAQAQRLESVGQLAGGVAHDFNNLLGVILNYAYFVREHLPDDNPLRTDVEEIHRAAERASDLTHQLLVFSRMESIKPEVLDLNAVVCEMDRMLRRTIGEHVRLVTEVSSEPCMVRADRGQLEQVVMNLVVNARDAMPAGGAIGVETRVVDLAADRADAPESLATGRYAVLSVRDEGTGMDPGVADRAFEPFFTTKPKGTGTGLGLATVYGTITAAGGEAEIETAPGMGTTVRAWLPEASRRDTPGARFAPESEREEPRSPRVVVEEDASAARRR